MKFSVVIPLYNGADLIEATLDTVLAQTYRDYEIVLVNDGSPDNVGEVVRKYISAHPETEFIYKEQENRGLGGARNTAIRHASGDVIAILDQDDLWYPDKLAKIAKIYRDNPGVDVICHSQKVRKNGEVKRIFSSGLCGKDVHRELLFTDNMLSTSASTFNKAVLADVGDFSEDKENFHFVEDFDLWLRMAEKGYRFYFTDEILGEYTEHDSNFSKDLEVMLKSELNVLKKHYKRLKRRNIWDFYLMRKNTAVIYFRTCREYFKTKRFFNGFKYLLRAFCTDPFFIITHAPYYFKKRRHNMKRLISAG